MRIIALVKQVPETRSVKMDEAAGTVIRQGVESIINPLDLYAIEAAITLKEQYGGEITVISMGPPQAEDAIREAIAMGADNGILVSDKAYAGSDTWATACILSEAIKRSGGYDLIICGERATDGDTGQVGPEIASRLNLPAATYINHIESVSGNECRLERMVENGTEKLAMKLPGLITVVKEASNPRLPTLRGKLKAKQQEIPVYNQEFLQLDAGSIGLKGSPTRVIKIFKPKTGRKCRMFQAADDKQIAGALGELMKFLEHKEPACK
jgi:electron transfer flavoprotein beta subunit